MFGANLSFRSSLAVLAVLGFVAIAGPASAAEDGKFDEQAVKAAIRYSVELSAQTEKMHLSLLFLTMGVDPEHNAEEIRLSQEFFRRVLEGFREGDPALGIPALRSPEHLERLAAIEGVWPLFDTALAEANTAEGSEPKEITEEQVKSIGALKVPLLKATTELAASLKAEAAAGSLYSMLVVATELSSGQRLLLETMSTEFMQVAYGHQAVSNRQKLSENYQRFELVLNGLINGNPELKILPAPTPEIRAQLLTVQQLWIQFALPLRSVVAGTQPDRQSIELVAGRVFGIAENMDEVVRLLDRL